MMIFFLFDDLHRIQTINVMEARVITLNTVMFSQFGMRRQRRIIRANVGERHGCGKEAMILDEKTLLVEAAVENVLVVGQLARVVLEVRLPIMRAQVRFARLISRMRAKSLVIICKTWSKSMKV